MSESLRISKIQLPDGVTYELKDPNAIADITLGSSYDSNTKTVILIASELEDADNTEY